MKHFFLVVLSLMCSLCLQAKNGKIKYGAYVVYEGGIEQKKPKGQGVLKLLSSAEKSTSIIEIAGDFDGDKVSNAKIVWLPLPQIDNVSSLHIIYDGEEGECSSVNVVINKAMVTASILNSSGGRVPSMEIDNLSLRFNLLNIRNLFLIGNHFSSRDMLRLDGGETKPSGRDLFSKGGWAVEYNTNDENRATRIKGTYSSPSKLSPLLTKLQYKLSMVDKAVDIFELTKEGFRAIFSPVCYFLKDGTKVEENKLTYANGNVVEIDTKSWTYWVGTRILPNGTRISCYQQSDGEYVINYVNPTKEEAYTGTVTQSNLLSPLYAQTTEPKFTYRTGTLTVNGVVTKWINGETTEQLRQRLNGTLDEKLLAMVENGAISESDAFTKQKLAMGSSLEGDLFRNAHPTAKTMDEYTKAKYGSSSDSKIKKLMDNDVIGYFDIKGVNTELQKKTFAQSDEYKMKYLPKLQEDKKDLLEKEFYFTMPIIMGSSSSYNYKGIERYKYDINTGRIEFELRDTENSEIYKGDTDFHVLLDGKRLTYPRSLVSLHSYQDIIMHTRTYDQKLQTCKISQASALKVDNNSCDMVWMYKITKLKDNKLYGKTTHLYIVNRKTKEIYCDLTTSLEASQANFKSVINEKDVVTYHEQGRFEECKWCGGNCFILGKICTICNGRGGRIEHWW